MLAALLTNLFLEEQPQPSQASGGVIRRPRFAEHVIALRGDLRQARMELRGEVLVLAPVRVSGDLVMAAGELRGSFVVIDELALALAAAVDD